MRDYYQQIIKWLRQYGQLAVLTWQTGDRAGQHAVWAAELLHADDKADAGILDAVNSGSERYQCQQKAWYEDRETGDAFYLERLAGNPWLVVLGAGHVGREVAQLGRQLDFRVFVLDPRPDFANMEQLPWAEKIICKSFDEAMDELPVYANSWFCIMTPGHDNDTQCARLALTRPHAYVGMIGSRAKVATARKRLSEAGLPDELIAALHAPIGLDIGAETPAEIAVSIMAEIVQLRGRERQIILETPLVEMLEAEDGPAVLTTVTWKHGSGPRAEGSRMLVRPDGSIAGTVGGGSVEVAVIRQALDLLAGGADFDLREYDLSASEASTLGMVCGGQIRVMFEHLGAARA